MNLTSGLSVKSPWQGLFSFLKDASTEDAELRFLGGRFISGTSGPHTEGSENLSGITSTIKSPALSPPRSCPKGSKGKNHLPMSPLPAWKGRSSPGARERATLWISVENLSCRGSCTSCRCKFWDVSAISEQTELGEDGKEEQSRSVSAERGSRGDW